MSCGTTDVGICEFGIQLCENNTWLECSNATLGTNELCNGLDDNCDGQTDETFENLTLACTVGVGACEASGVYVCANESAVTCNATPGVGTTEKCSTSIDDDCDGDVNENCKSNSPGGPSGPRNDPPPSNVSNVTNTSNVTIPVNNSGSGEIDVVVGESEDNASDQPIVEEEEQEIETPGEIPPVIKPFWKRDGVKLVSGIIIFLVLISAVIIGIKAGQKRKALASGKTSTSEQGDEYLAKIINYVADMRARGVKDTEIKNNLIKAGNSEKIIEEALKKL
jgi:hypothetical protein